MDAVIFDFDGVLVNSFNIIYQSYNEVCKKLNIPTFQTVKEFKDFYTVDFWQNYESLGLKTEEQKRKAYDTIQEYVEKHYMSAEFFGEMVDIVVELKDRYGMKIGIASTGEARVIKQKLQGTRLEDKFDAIVGFEMVKNIKPYPEPVLLASKLIGIPPERCAFVGDTGVDIRAGKATKVGRTIGIGMEGAYESIEKIAGENPDAIIIAPHELYLFI